MRLILRLALCGVLLFAAATGASPAHAAPATTTGSHLTLSASINGSMAVMRGTLTAANRRPIANALVTVAIDSTLTRTATTDATGRWSVSLPLPWTISIGSHTVVALYVPLDPDQSANASTAITRTQGTASRIVARASASRIAQGSTVTVTGRLATTDGRPLVGETLTIGTPDADGNPCLAVTGTNGRFSAAYLVHEAPGALRLALTFTGSDLTNATTARLALTVVAGRTPSRATQPTLAPPAPYSTVGNGPGDLQPGDPTTPLPAKPVASAHAVWAPAFSGRQLGLMTVGGLALLTSLAMLGRSLRGSAEDAEEAHLIDD